MSSERALNRVISKFGDTVIVRPREKTVTDQGAPEYTFPEVKWFRTKALMYDASGLREQWYVIGIDMQVDYVASMYAYLKDNLNIHDLVSLTDGTVTEIVNIVKRGKAGTIDHLELLLRKVAYD